MSAAVTQAAEGAPDAAVRRISELEAASLRDDERHAEAMRSVRLRTEHAEERADVLATELARLAETYLLTEILRLAALARKERRLSR